MEEYINIFKALSDKTRLRIVWLLKKANLKLCVCEIMDSLNENQYNVSRHLRILKNMRLLNEEKDGRWVYYSLIKPKNQFQILMLKALSTMHEEYFYKEAERLKKRLAFRENGKCVDGVKGKRCYKM